MINMIWAMDENFLIGKGNLIPWHIKEDLIYYKSKTKDQVVLMGDTTYFSLKSYYKDKPLPYKRIYVATIDMNLVINDDKHEVIIIHDIISLLKTYFYKKNRKFYNFYNEDLAKMKWKKGRRDVW